MATIPRTYMITSKDGLSNVPLKNGQIISIWDADEVWYDAPANGEPDGAPVRRKISGVRVVSTLPENPMTDIVYVYIGDQGTLPESDQPFYDMRIWLNNAWTVVGTNKDDANVKTAVSDNKFYLVGTSDITDNKIGSLLKNSAVYVNGGVIFGDLEGTAHYATEATHAAQATVADRAINDNFSTPQPITSYIRGVTSDATTDLGTTLTLIKGDGTTSTVRVSNTTYDVFTEDPTKPGLVNGINTVVGSDNTDLLLTGSGWVDMNNIDIPHANQANNDGVGQLIADTYIKSLSYNSSTDLLTITWGDDDTDTISIPDTTYTVFTYDTDGLVPGPTLNDSGKFLKGDGTWDTVVTSDYQGATSGAAGVHGLVPAAASGNVNSYLRSDGVWAGVFGQDSNGLVPGPATTDPAYSLRADGTWDICPDTKNTTGATNDVSHKLFLVGTQTQGTEPQSYTNINVFIDSNKLYSYSVTDSTPVEVVTLSDTQALTNKTYNGYTLGTACEGTIASSINSSTITGYDNFEGDGSTTTFALTATALAVTSVTIDGVFEQNYTLQSNSVVFTTAPANGSDIEVAYTKTNPNYNPDDLPKNSAVASYVSNRITADVLSRLSAKLDTTVVAATYDEVLGTYKYGDYCIYEDANGINLYKCIYASGIPTPEAFDYTKWQQVTITSCFGAEIVATLAAGSTTLTISDNRITTNSMIDYYTDVYGVSPSNMTVSTGQIVFTFPAQASAVNVKVVLR